MRIIVLFLMFRGFGVMSLAPFCSMLQEGTRRLRDTDPVPLRNLFHEFEANGMVDFTVNGHVTERPEGH